MPDMGNGVSDRDEDFEVAMLAAAKIALDQDARASDGRSDALPAFPWQIDIGIVVPEVPEFDAAIRGIERGGDFEIVMLPAAEIALDDCAGTRDVR